MNELQQIQHLRRLNWNARIARARLKVGDPLRTAHVTRLERFMRKIEARKIIPMPTREPYVSIHHRRKAAALARTAMGLAFTLCLWASVVNVSAQVKGAQFLSRNSGTQKKISVVPALPKPTLSATVPTKTNGVVTLKWSNGDPAETTLVNQTTGTVYPATTTETITVGGLAVGTKQTFVATNTAGASAPVSTTIAADTLKLNFTTWLYLTWPGPAGILQRSTNLVLWTDDRAIASNGAVIITNATAREFYRVKIN